MIVPVPYVIALALLLAGCVVAAYFLGYERGRRTFGVVWRKAPEHVLQNRKRAENVGDRPHQRQVTVAPTSRDRVSITGRQTILKTHHH